MGIADLLVSVSDDDGMLIGVPHSHRSAVDWVSGDVDHVPPGLWVSSFPDLVAGDDSEARLFEDFSHGGVGVDLARLLGAAGEGPLSLAVMLTERSRHRNHDTDRSAAGVVMCCLGPSLDPALSWGCRAGRREPKRG